MALDLTKVAALHALIAAGGKPAVCQIFKVTWDETAPVVNYYAGSALTQTLPFVGLGFTVEPRIIFSNVNDPFHTYEINSDLRTEQIKITFDDIDKDITGKFQTYGSGVQIEILMYYPDVDLMASMWFGQLQAPKVYGWRKLETVATNGHRSREMVIPGRDKPKECSGGMNFGGSLPTAEAKRTNGCPYDRDIGGTEGLLNGAVPFTDCAGLTHADCIARFGHARYFLGFLGIDANAVIVDSQPGYLAHTRGNTSALKDPVRVIFGTKIVRDPQILLWRREINPNDEDKGFVRGLYEVGEGPVRSITGIKIKDKLIEQIHLAIGYGVRGQAAVGYSSTASNFSKTAHFSAAYGWTNPLNETAQSIVAECKVDGFREVAVYNDTAAGNGVKGTYYDSLTYTNPVGNRIDYEINFPDSSIDPVEGVSSSRGFTIKWEGFVSARYTQNYTFTCIHDDSVEVRVNGVLIINQAAPGTHPSAAVAMTADTPVAIEVKLKQVATIALPNRWGCILKWQSSSQALEVVPNSRLTHNGASGYIRQWSNDRVWCLHELYTNQAFGLQYPYSRFYIPDWNTASTWGRQIVEFEHTFPDGEVKTYTRRRTTFDAILQGRPAAEQIEDVCRSGAISVPFQHEGLFTIREFRAATTTELTNARVFTDEGSTKNIIWDGSEPSISLEQVPDDKITNEIKLTFEDGANFDNERPFTVDDRDQKLRAGRILGSDHLQTVPKSYTGFGIRYVEEAIRLAFRLLWFGEFDEGGIHNNLSVNFTVPFEQILGIRRYDVIKIVSALITGFLSPDGNQFEYFRVLEINKIAGGRAQVVAQAYNHQKYTAFETVVPDQPPDDDPPDDDPPDDPPCEIAIDSVSYDAANQQLVVELSDC